MKTIGILLLSLLLLPLPLAAQTLPPPPSCHDGWIGGPYGVGWVCYSIGGILPGCYPSLCQNPDNIVACGPADGATRCVEGLQWIGLSAEDKRLAGMVATGLDLVGAGMMFLPGPIFSLSGKMIALVGLGFTALVVDPYDPNYLETAMPFPALFTSVKRDCIMPPHVPAQAENLVTCNVTTAEALATNSLAGNLSITSGLLEAMRVTSDRGTSAATDGNQQGLNLQTAWMAQLKTVLKQYVAEAGPLRERLAVIIERRNPDGAALLRNPDLLAAEAAFTSAP